MKPNEFNNTRQDPFFSDGLVQQQPYYGAGFQGQQPYPGVSSFNGFAPAAQSTALATPAASTGLLAGLPFNMTQVKGFIDRMGGIDGVMGHVGRIQKFIQSMQQMGPMLKVLMGSFGSKASTAAKLDGDGLTSAGRRRRRSTRRKTIKAGKKSYKRRSR
ncbi:aminotransferase [Paenibacillus psychroresistens]|uniref:Aminotransferase n=1 Tax=Paenibacillus psychroresistens TaxID=1778678 RepID=A0A6B8RD42_9BACL|nr:aminotransferase [Paenibacillus psychroresistens]QGQ94149.1 aminotransferase [Paenibacillus psychroresistens]